MPLYKYRAADANDRIVKGQIEALHETDLETQLSRVGLSLVRATITKARTRKVKSLPQQEIIGFMFQLEMLIRAGVPILAALGDMRDSAESMEGQILAAGVYQRVENGSTLAEALAFYPGIFSEVMVNLVRSGEVTGQLPEVLKELVRSLKWQDELAAQTKKLMMYPTFVVVVISGVVFFLMIYLVPQLVTFLAGMGQKTPLQTRILIVVSDIFVRYWWLILAIPPVIVTVLAGVIRVNERARFAAHRMLLGIPVIGAVLKKMILARLADTFALMYKTGIPIMFPTLVIRMLQVGEASGALDHALNNVSYFYTREIDESIGKVQALIEPVMTVAMGLILGWIMMAVLSPIYDTISKMKT